MLLLKLSDAAIKKGMCSSLHIAASTCTMDISNSKIDEQGSPRTGREWSAPTITQQFLSTLRGQ